MTVKAMPVCLQDCTHLNAIPSGQLIGSPLIRFATTSILDACWPLTSCLDHIVRFLSLSIAQAVQYSLTPLVKSNADFSSDLSFCFVPVCCLFQNRPVWCFLLTTNIHLFLRLSGHLETCHVIVRESNFLS